MLPPLEVIAAGPGQQAVLENLLELYIHDFSEFIPLDVGEDGRFGYPGLAPYWREPDHHAFLARIAGKLAGFALVRRTADPPEATPAWDMTEFFVLRRYRRQHAGTRFAQAIWNLHPGDWRVRVRADNVAAMRFWQAAISGFIGGPPASRKSVVSGVLWQIFLFRSPVLH